MELKERIENLLSEILSDKHQRKVTVKFEKKEQTYEEPKEAYI